jgi:dihydroorotase
LKKIAFVNGRLVNSRSKDNEILNVLLINGNVAGLGYLPDDDGGDVFDANNCIIIPGIVDSYVDLREPGDNSSETIETGAAAAANAGITSLICSANTDPVIDSAELATYINIIIKEKSKLPIYPLGSITKQAKGEELSEMGLMLQNNVVGFSDNKPLKAKALMVNALKYSQMFSTVLIINPASDFGIMNEGYYSTILGLPASSAADEEIALERDIKLLEHYGGRIHFSPISTAGSVEIIKRAKQKGLKVTCGTAPHYLCFSEKDIDGYDANYKVNPPLRTESDINALIAGIKDGTIDVLASHHKPCKLDEKRHDFNTAKFGISGLDFFLPAIINKLHHEEGLELQAIARLISENPRIIFGLPKPTISLKAKPSFTIIDIKQEQTITKEDIKSKGKNSPFIGKKLKAKVKATIVNGEILYNNLPKQS